MIGEWIFWRANVAESAIQRKIRSLLESWGAVVFKQAAGIYSTTGAPDLVACFKGRFLAIEVKKPGKEATRIQLHRQTQIRKSGGICEICDSAEQVDRILRAIDAGKYDDN